MRSQLSALLGARLTTEALRREGVAIGAGARVAGGSAIGRGTVIGHDTVFNGPARINGPGITIGAYNAIGHDLRIVSLSHSTRHANVLLGMHWRYGFVDLQEHEPVTVGSGCWIGDRVTILPGAIVGDGSVLAAGAVVRGTVPPYTIVGGVPAKLLKRRCPEDVAGVLVGSRWWDWPEERKARSRQFFEADIATVTAEYLASVAEA